MRPRTTVVIQGDSKIVVPDDISVLTTFVLREQEDWFEDEIHFVRKMVFTGMKSIDIGASYGLYTVALAKGSGDAGRVISFEPTPETADCLAETIRLNNIDNVEVKQMAVSEGPGMRYLCNGSSTELNHLAKDLVENTVYLQVHSRSIDDLRNTCPAGIDFVKIDAEGEEENIINGARLFLQEESPLLMFELNDERRSDFSLFNHLIGWGYHIYRLLPGLNILVPLCLGVQLPRYILNVFCCKIDRAARLQEQGLLLVKNEDRDEINIDEDVWIQKCSSVETTKAYVTRWAQAVINPSSRVKRYITALNLVVISEDDCFSSAVRVAALKKAAMLLNMLCDVEPTVPRLSTLARVMGAVGDKIAACEVIQKALNLCTDLKYEVSDEPFLLPDIRMEWRDAEGDFLVVALFEKLQRLCCSSTYFCPEFYLEIIEDFVKRRIMTPELERRRQLALMLLNRQLTPEPKASLKYRAPDNLNPEFWNGNVLISAQDDLAI
jgi:FkbM family methyltransferase